MPRRLVITFLTLVLVGVGTAPANTGVHLRVQGENVYEGQPIRIAVVNGSKEAIGFCQVSCGMILAGEAVPEFHVQIRKRLRWTTYYWACDAGSWDKFFTLGPGQTHEVAIRLSAGRYRLRLNYRAREQVDLDDSKGCSLGEPGDGSKEASVTFEVKKRASK